MNLISQLRDRLGLAKPTSDDSDLELAAAVMLIEMARADDSEDAAEREAVAAALRKSFPDLSESVTTLMDRARSEHVDLVSFFPYIEQLNAEWDRDAKMQLLKQLWRVAQADGRIDKFEEHYLRRVCELLNLPPKAFVQVREGFTE